MKRMFILAAFLLPLAAAAAPPTLEELYPAEPDPIMGNYIGRWSDNVEVDPTVAAQVIPLGRDEYRIRIVSKIDMRCPPIAEFEAKAEDGVIAFKDGSLSGELRDGKITGKRGSGTVTFEMTKEEKPSPTLGMAPPEGAAILCDGTSFDAWHTPKGWELAGGGVMRVTPEGEYLVTKELFGDCRIHVEFRTPYMPRFKGQQRGNSGVFIQDVYEVQVLDSFGLEAYYDDCGALYKVAAPKVNACRPPLQWQTFDITFRSARYEDGKLVENARITVLHNGVPIHMDQEMWWVTGWTEKDRLAPPPSEPRPIKLQGHDNYVEFRNMWVLPGAE